MTVDRTQIAVGIGPFIPDRDTVILEVLYVRIPGDKPQELVDDGLQMHLLGSQEGESLRQVEPHLIAEHALRAGTGPVLLHDAMGADMSQQIQVLFHRLQIYG